MAKIISIFNNKGGVGKSTIAWNMADALGDLGKKVLVIDFDPQCNLSLAMLGEDIFVRQLPTVNEPYGMTIRAFLQRFLQGTGGEEVFPIKGPHTSKNVSIIPGDFWLNVYADSLNVGADLLTGTGLARYVALQRIVSKASEADDVLYDYVIVDLPPSFGALVRASFYSSDYYIVPCTSDNFSVYCVGLIGQMVPSFVRDWQTGIGRFRESNPHFNEFDQRGQPVFAGWAFNGFDTMRQRRTQAQLQSGVAPLPRQLVQADEAMRTRVVNAVRTDLVDRLRQNITHYEPVTPSQNTDFQLGDIEDANVLIQNSLWLSVPLGKLDQHQQVVDLQNRRQWAANQVVQIQHISQKFADMARSVVATCV